MVRTNGQGGTLGESYRRFLVFITESYSILRAVWDLEPKEKIGLANPKRSSLRRGMVGVVLFSVVIATFMALVPMILGDTVEAIKRGDSFASLAVRISVSVFLLRYLPSAIEAARDIIIQCWFRSRLIEVIDTRCIERHLSLDEQTRARSINQPLLKGGRVNLTEFVEGLLRDPLFAVVSIGLIGYLAWFTPLVVPLIIARIFCELLVTSRMDHCLRQAFTQQQKRESGLESIESKVLANDPEENGGCIDRFHQRMQAYIDILNKNQVARAWYEKVTREGVSALFTGLIMVTLVVYVAHGTIGIGTFVTFAGFAEKAAEPFRGLYALQGELMRRRPSIRFLGSLTGISFGIDARVETPEEA